MSSAPRGLAPRKDLELVLMKMGRAGPPLEPRRRPQAGKSRDPCSQNADKPGRQEPGHLFSNGLVPFFIEPSEKLSDRFKLWINIESVLSEFPWDTRHV